MKKFDIRTLCGEKQWTKINLFEFTIFHDNELGLIIVNQKSEVKTGWILAILYVVVRIFNELFFTTVQLSIINIIISISLVYVLYVLSNIYIRINNLTMLFSLIEEDFKFEAKINRPEATYPETVKTIFKQLISFIEEKAGKYFLRNKSLSMNRIKKFIDKLNWIWSNPDAVRYRDEITKRNIARES